MLPASMHDIGLFAYSLFFFALTYYFAINPSSLVDKVGKVMTPLLLICLAALITCVIVNPMGSAQPATGDYVNAPFFKGFFEGYNTMDALCSLLFGSATIAAIESKGIKDVKQLTKVCIYSGLVAAACLAIVYVALAYTGLTSVEVTGMATNGAQLLSTISQYYFGDFGKVILAFIIFFACITTSIGLTNAISSYFSISVTKNILYDRYVVVICLFSFGVSNIGLSNIIKFSIPVLCMLYPIIIALVLLNIGKDIFKGDSRIFRPCLILTTLFAIIDGLRAAGIDPGAVDAMLAQFVPLYDIGFGWIAPCCAGIVLGFIWKACTNKEA